MMSPSTVETLHFQNSVRNTTRKHLQGVSADGSDKKRQGMEGVGCHLTYVAMLLVHITTLLVVLSGIYHYTSASMVF